MSDRLTEIEERLKATTPGPWNLEFIAHASSDVAFLLARVRELEAEVVNLHGEQVAGIHFMRKAEELEAQRDKALKVCRTVDTETDEALQDYLARQVIEALGGTE